MLLAVSAALHVFFLWLSYAPGTRNVTAHGPGTSLDRQIFDITLPQTEQTRLPDADGEVPNSGNATLPVPAPNPPAQEAPRQLPETRNGLFVGDWYYTAQYLHRRPTPLKPIYPDYPEVPVSQQDTIRIRIRLFINAEGGVDSYRLEEGEKHRPFALAVINAFAAATFAPGLIADTAVKSQLLAEVSFEPGQRPTYSLGASEGQELTPVRAHGEGGR